MLARVMQRIVMFFSTLGTIMELFVISFFHVMLAARRVSPIVHAIVSMLQVFTLVCDIRVVEFYFRKADDPAMAVLDAFDYVLMGIAAVTAITGAILLMSK